MAVATRQCPNCKEMVHAEANICRYCGTQFFKWRDVWKGVGLFLVGMTLFLICALLNQIPAP
jgi:hypothetical protein